MNSNSQKTLNVAARIGAGAISGVAATFVMDAITDVFYTAHIKEVEAGVSPRGAAAGVALMMLKALRLEPTEKDAEKAGLVLHWFVGICTGALAGLLTDDNRVSSASASAIATAGMLGFDEYGVAMIGASLPSSAYPWQTNLRSLVGHAIYGFTLSAAFAYAASLTNQRR